MIKELVSSWEENKDLVRQELLKKHPEDYKELVTMLLSKVATPLNLDLSNLTELDHGDYQGSLVYIIPENTYQPCTYYGAMISYGSCSVCDTLQRIKDYSDGLPNEEQVEQYMALCLHIVQKFKKLFGWDD